MTNYEPRDRRPIAGALRRTADAAVRLCVRCDVSPNAVSVMSMVAAGGAGACFLFAWWNAWLLVGGVALCFVRLWLNMLDGMVALASGKASRLGEVFNEVPDRISDGLIFAGVAYSGLCRPWLGLWVVAAAILVAYIGLFGQAVNVGRQFGGVMSKPWRMVTLSAGAVAALVLFLWEGEHWTWGGWSVLDVTMIVILLGCAQTFVLRLMIIMRKLKGEG